MTRELEFGRLEPAEAIDARYEHQLWEDSDETHIGDP